METLGPIAEEGKDLLEPLRVSSLSQVTAILAQAPPEVWARAKLIMTVHRFTKPPSTHGYLVEKELYIPDDVHWVPPYMKGDEGGSKNKRL